MSAEHFPFAVDSDWDSGCPTPTTPERLARTQVVVVEEEVVAADPTTPASPLLLQHSSLSAASPSLLPSHSPPPGQLPVSALTTQSQVAVGAAVSPTTEVEVVLSVLP